MTASHEKRADGTFVLNLIGKLTTQEIGIESGHAPKREDLQENERILIDLSKANSISVGALRWLAHIEYSALEQGKSVIYKGASPQVIRSLQSAAIGLMAQFI